VIRKNVESYNPRNKRLLSLTLNLETKSHSLSTMMSNLSSIVVEHFTIDVLSSLYFVNHLLFCFHRRRSLASFSCNRCLVQCVLSGAEFDDDDVDDDGQDASEDDTVTMMMTMVVVILMIDKISLEL